MMNNVLPRQKHDELMPGLRDGRALLGLARDWLKQGNPVVAAELLGVAITSDEAERDVSLRACILKETGRVKAMQSDWDSSETFYLEAQRVFLSIDEFRGAAEAARNRANISFQQGKFDQAQTLCEQALEWATEIADYELRATILNTMGAIMSATGEPAEAVKDFKLCLADFQSAGNRIRQGYVLLNIGLALVELNEYGEAINNLNQSLAIALEEKDLSLVEICYQNISRCYLEQKEMDLAKSVIDTARRILPGLNSIALENELNLIDARILMAMGSLDDAEALLVATGAATAKHSQKALAADVLREQGNLARLRGQLHLAISRFDAAAERYRQVGNEKGFKECIASLNQLQRGSHD